MGLARRGYPSPCHSEPGEESLSPVRRTPPCSFSNGNLRLQREYHVYIMTNVSKTLYTGVWWPGGRVSQHKEKRIGLHEEIPI
jgi:hypothetical protein